MGCCQLHLSIYEEFLSNLRMSAAETCWDAQHCVYRHVCAAAQHKAHKQYLCIHTWLTGGMPFPMVVWLFRYIRSHITNRRKSFPSCCKGITDMCVTHVSDTLVTGWECFKAPVTQGKQAHTQVVLGTQHSAPHSSQLGLLVGKQDCKRLQEALHGTTLTIMGAPSVTA